MQQFRRFLAALACLVVGVSSFALSFVALRDVAIAVGAVPAYLGFLVPIVIDGGIICGSAVIWSLSKETARRPVFPFLFVGSLVVVSVVVNTNHAGEGVLAKGIAALPPLILLGTLELVAAQGRRQAAPVTVAGTVAPSTLVATAMPMTVHVNATAPVSNVDSMPATSPTTSTPTITPVHAAPVHTAPVLSALVPTEQVGGVVHGFDDAIDGELEQLVESYADGSPRRPRPAATRRPMRVRAEEPLS